MSAVAYDALLQSESLRRLLDARLVQIVVGADPAAGQEFTITPPGGVVWEVLALSFTLATSAVVANRSNTIVLDDGARIFGQYAMQDIQTASSTVRYSYAHVGFGKTTFSNLSIFGPIPDDTFLTSGWRLRSLTASLDAGDDYSAPLLLVRQISPYDLRAVARSLEDELAAFR